jgi:hypothetical protein
MSNEMIGRIALWIVAGLFASIILAAIRNPLMVRFVNSLFALVAVLFIIPEFALAHLIPILGRFAAWLRSSMTGSRGPVSMGDVVGPLIYFVCFAVLIAGDAYFALQSIPQLVGGTAPKLNGDLFAPATAVLWVAIFISIFAALLDLLGVTHFLKAYDLESSPIRKWMRVAALIAFGLVMLTAVGFGYFRDELTRAANSGGSAIDTALTVLFFVIITVATIAAGPALWEGIAPLLLVVATLLSFVAHTLRFVLHIPVEVLDKLAGLLVGLYDTLTVIGRGIWNYLSQLTENTRGRIPRLPDPEKRPHIGDIITLPDL